MLLWISYSISQSLLNNYFANIYGREQGIRMASEVSSFVKARLVIGKIDGIVRKAEIINENGIVTASLTLTDLKIATQMEDDEFKYTPSDGGMIIDLEKYYNTED
jgi:outer membrane lipoprotein-sorting protein